MSKKFQAVKGTRDLLPPKTVIWSGVEDVARRVFGTYGYREIRTPILEDTELFVRSVGESTDIVGKEMYTFDDRKGRSLTLRPENTASVVRAFVQHGLQSEPLPVKLFYIGPQFRYERPQKGRYRQFHQIGAELIGDPGPYSDAELILMLVRFLSELGFENLVVQLNTVGDEDSRAAYRLGLQEFLEPRRHELTPDSQRRLQTNPLRILDTKDPGERDLLVSAPQLVDYLTEESRTHFETVQRDSRPKRSVVPSRASTGQGTRLLHENGVRNRFGGLGCSGRHRRRRALRWPGGGIGRSIVAGYRVCHR